MHGDSDSKEVEAVVVTALGLSRLAIGGMDLVVDERPVDLAPTVAYKGIMPERDPEVVLALGDTTRRGR